MLFQGPQPAKKMIREDFIDNEVVVLSRKKNKTLMACTFSVQKRQFLHLCLNANCMFNYGYKPCACLGRPSPEKFCSLLTGIERNCVCVRGKTK